MRMDTSRHEGLDSGLYSRVYPLREEQRWKRFQSDRWHAEPALVSTQSASMSGRAFSPNHCAELLAIGSILRRRLSTSYSLNEHRSLVSLSKRLPSFCARLMKRMRLTASSE